jgi:hypothetical protein
MVRNKNITNRSEDAEVTDSWLDIPQLLEWGNEAQLRLR